MSRIDSAEAFAAHFEVGETAMTRLIAYEAHIRRWQKAVNLVAPRTLDDIWHRHFADSAQLAALIPEETRTLVDLGSGAGLPAIVLAILFLSQASRPPPAITLIESDQRKAAFLRDVARTVEIEVQVLSTRIESDATVHAVGKADAITARALAPLERLFPLAFPYCSASSVCVFPKGRDARSEIERAARDWSFDHELVPSLTDSAAHIAVIRRLRRTHEG